MLEILFWATVVYAGLAWADLAPHPLQLMFRPITRSRRREPLLSPIDVYCERLTQRYVRGDCTLEVLEMVAEYIAEGGIVDSQGYMLGELDPDGIYDLVEGASAIVTEDDIYRRWVKA